MCARTRLRVMMDHVASVCSRPIPFPSPPSANTTVDSQESPDRDAEKFRIALSLKEHIIGFRRQMKLSVCAPMDVKLYMYSCIYLFVCATRGRVPLLVVANLVPRQLAFSDAKYMHAHTRTLRCVDVRFRAQSSSSTSTASPSMTSPPTLLTTICCELQSNELSVLLRDS